MKMKKAFIWLLLVSFGLTGCGNSVKNETSDTENYEETVSEEIEDIDETITTEEEIAPEEETESSIPESIYTPYETSDVPKLETGITLEPEITEDIVLAKNPVGNLESIDDFDAKFAGALGGPSIDLKSKEIRRVWYYDSDNFTGVPINCQMTSTIIGEHDATAPSQIYKIEYCWDNLVSLQPKSLEVECFRADNINTAKTAFETAAKDAIHDQYLNAMLNEVTELTTEPNYDGCISNSLDSSITATVTDGPDINYWITRQAFYPVKDASEGISYPKLRYSCSSSRSYDPSNLPSSNSKFEGYLSPEEALKELPLDVTKLTSTYNPMALKKYKDISTFIHKSLIGQEDSRFSFNIRGYDENNCCHTLSVNINQNNQFGGMELEISDIPIVGTDHTSTEKLFTSLVKKYFDYDLKKDEYYSVNEEEGILSAEFISKVMDQEASIEVLGGYNKDCSLYSVKIRAFPIYS